MGLPVTTTTVTTTTSRNGVGVNVIAMPSLTAKPIPTVLAAGAAAPIPTADGLAEDPALAVEGLLVASPGPTGVEDFVAMTLPQSIGTLVTITSTAYPSPSNGSEATPWGTYVYTEDALAMVIAYPFICFVLIALAMELNLMRWRKKNVKSKVVMEWP